MNYASSHDHFRYLRLVKFNFNKGLFMPSAICFVDDLGYYPSSVSLNMVDWIGFV